MSERSSTTRRVGVRGGTIAELSHAVARDRRRKKRSDVVGRDGREGLLLSVRASLQTATPVHISERAAAFSFFPRANETNKTVYR